MYVFTCVYILVWPGSGVNHMSKSPSQCLCLHPLWAQVYYALKNVDKATPGHLEVIEPGALPCRFWMVLHLDCVTGGIGLVGTIWMQCFSAASTLEITSATAAWSASLFGLHGCFVPASSKMSRCLRFRVPTSRTLTVLLQRLGAIFPAPAARGRHRMTLCPTALLIHDAKVLKRQFS